MSAPGSRPFHQLSADAIPTSTLQGTPDTSTTREIQFCHCVPQLNHRASGSLIFVLLILEQEALDKTANKPSPAVLYKGGICPVPGFRTHIPAGGM